jgi:hypothetical protein
VGNKSVPDARPSAKGRHLAEMREGGVRGLLVYCANYCCSRSIAISGDQRADEVRLSDIESRFVCRACGKRGADVRPDFNWNRKQVSVVGCRRVTF